MSTIPPRLRWACRRGMLELDVLLGNFLEEAYSKLPSNEQDKFVKLLDCQDQELFEWFTGKRAPIDPDLIFIVEKILNHARHRHIT